jgi:hypothetical protein
MNMEYSSAWKLLQEELRIILGINLNKGAGTEIVFNNNNNLYLFPTRD